MLRLLRIMTFALISAVVGFVLRTAIRTMESQSMMYQTLPIPDYSLFNINVYPKNIFTHGNGILFLETTDRMEPPSLVLCALESAARQYPDRPIGLFMKGLDDIVSEEDMSRTRNLFPALSSLANVFFIPLRLEELFNNTPFQSWYEKVDPQKETFWIHVLSDACRFALIWTYGGIYMDTDIISTQPIPSDYFFAPQSTDVISSGVYGLPRLHSLAWELMNNFVKNYRGEIWGHQGPGLVTRVLLNKCRDSEIRLEEDIPCGPITLFFPDRFYPISFNDWQKYFIKWDTPPTFNNSYGLHLWNYMNKNQETMVPGNETLVEHLYKNYCPSVYKAERKKHEDIRRTTGKQGERKTDTYQ